jgi:outer membrane protein assembly factor BamB
MTRFDAAGRGYNPDTTVPTGNVDIAWARPVATDPDRLVAGTTAPVTDDRTVYVGAGRGDPDPSEGIPPTVVAFDGATGERRWETTLGGRRSIAGLAVADDTVVAATNWEGVFDGPGQLVTLDASDGTERQGVPLPGTARGPTSAPVVVDDLAYVTTQGGGLIGADIGGSPVWQETLDGTSPNSRYTAPCVADGAVVAGAGGDIQGVLAVDATHGHRLWTSRAFEPETDAFPATAGGAVYLPGQGEDGGRLHALALSEGTERWRASIDPDTTGFVVADGAVYASAGSAGAVPLAPADGSQRTDLPSTGLGMTARTVRAGDVFVGRTTSERVGGFSTTGSAGFTQPLATYASDPRFRIALAHDQVYVTVDEGRLWALGSKQSTPDG